MQTFTVTGRSAGFAAGALLALTDVQLARCSDLVRTLDPAPEGLPEKFTAVEVVRRIEFKRGESVTLLSDHPLNPSLVAEIAPPDSAAARDARASQAARRRKGAEVNRKRENDNREAEKNRAAARKSAGKKGPAKKKPSSKKPKDTGAAGDTAAASRKGRGTMETVGAVVPPAAK